LAPSQSDLSRIVTALRRSPVYVAPSLAPALPDRRGLLAAIRRAPVPVFVMLVPLVAGGEWPDAEHLAGAVHGRLRRSGVYLALDATNDLVAAEYGVDRDASDAAWAVNLDPAMDNVSLADRLTRCVELIASGRAHAEYQKQSDALDERIKADREGPRRHGGDATPFYVAGGGGAGVVLAAVAGLLVWRRRRVHRMRLLRRPRPVVTDARSLKDLRERAEAELVSLGEALAQTQKAEKTEKTEKADRAEKTESAEGDRLEDALDAYSAAGKALDAARTVPDLAGVLVLVDMGRDLSEAPRRGLTPLCFFNPLHGDGPVTVRWRMVGGRERVNVRACPECARAVRARKEPDVLRDGETPYYEADPERSVWATTGYGQFRGDLVRRVLRGDLHRT
jgi:hypothetical protein